MSDLETIYARWLSGELGDQEVEALKSSGEWDELQAIIDGVSKLSLPVYNKEKAYNQLTQHRKVQAKPTKRLAYQALIGLAASLAIAVGVFFWLAPRSSSIIAKSGQQNEYTFTEGTNVKLNAGSEIKYFKDEWADRRIIELDGEALFNVSKGVPFLVKTNSGTIEVLGTVFNVKERKGVLKVTCFSGKVSVKTSKNEVILSQSQSVNSQFDEFGEVEIIQHQAPYWTLGESRFTNESVIEVFKEVERQFDISIQSKKTQIKFSGSFTHTDLETALNQICKPLGLQYDIKQDKKTVIVSD